MGDRVPTDTGGLKAILPHTAQVHDDDLSVGGCSLRALARDYGTPLYVYDHDTIEGTAGAVRRAFSCLDARISFASKACAIGAVLKLFEMAGLGLDVVSEGELVAGMRAGFSPDRIHLHGNYKTSREIGEAIGHGLHAIVVDNLRELQQLETLCRRDNRDCRVMLRLALPLEAETHPSLMTAGRHSKFGLSSEEEGEALAYLATSRRLRATGLHVHLGSQITDAAIFARAAEALVGRIDELLDRGMPIEEISIGGGWAVPYRSGDPSLPPEDVAAAIAPPFAGRSEVRPAVEPGRALVARAGIAVYRTGSVKHSPAGRIIAVDGGMGDNPRPALYDARYQAIAVESPLALSRGRADVVGRYCESGDVLAREVALPEVKPESLIALPVSGAYQLSMTSGYNLVPAPAAVMVKDGNARLISRRGTIEDLLARDV